LQIETYVATSEVTALKHELRNDSVEGRARVSEALLAGAESAEVLSSLWDDFVVEKEVNATLLLYEGKHVSFLAQKAVLVGESDDTINISIANLVRSIDKQLSAQWIYVS